MHCKRAGDQYLLFSLKEVFITSCKVGKLCSLSSLGMCKAAVSLDLSVHCHRVQCVSVSTSGEIFISALLAAAFSWCVPQLLGHGALVEVQ